MSHNTETKEIGPEISNNSNKSDNAIEERDQEEKITMVERHEEEKPEKSSRNKVDLKERNQQQKDPIESSQQETDSTRLNQNQVKSTETDQEKVDPTETEQEKVDPTETEQEKVDPTETNQQKIDSTKSRQDYVEVVVKDEETNQANKEQRSLRQFVIWTAAEFFDYNPQYLTQVRGIANLINIVLSLTDLILLSLFCQLRPYTDSSTEGFYCKPPEMFLFTVSCCSFLTAVLYFFCCMLSKGTDFLLFHTAFEVGYFILYFILFITAGMVVLVNLISWESEVWYYIFDSTPVEAAAIIGLVNGIIYALSAVWYFMNHCQQEGSVIEIPELE